VISEEHRHLNGESSFDVYIKLLKGAIPEND